MIFSRNKIIVVFAIILLASIISVQSRSYLEKNRVVKIINSKKSVNYLLNKIDPNRKRIKIRIIDSLDQGYVNNLDSKVLSSSDHYLIFYVEGIIPYKFIVYCHQDAIIYYEYK